MCKGVSTRKVKAVTESLWGHSFSASSISGINKSLDAGLRAFAEQRLIEPFPYVILDARYEKVREAGIIVSQAVLVEVAVDGEGRRQVWAVELAKGIPAIPHSHPECRWLPVEIATLQIAEII